MGQINQRILVVEDEDAIRALLLTVLRRRGFHVDTARNGLEALERCERCHYVVILLDVMMPLMDGYAFLEALCQREGRRPVVIVLTAAGMTRPMNPEVVAGTIRKPFDVELLVDTVAACLTAVPEVDQPPGCPAADSDTDTPRVEIGNRRDESN